MQCQPAVTSQERLCVYFAATDKFFCSYFTLGWDPESELLGIIGGLLQAGRPSCHQTNSVKALKATTLLKITTVEQLIFLSC